MGVRPDALAGESGSVLPSSDDGGCRELVRYPADPETMTAYEHAFSMQEVYTWLGRQQARYIRYGFGLWALLDAGTGVFVGQVGLTIQDTPGGPELEIGYLLKRRFWHRGYAVRRRRPAGISRLRVWRLPGW